MSLNVNGKASMIDGVPSTARAQCCSSTGDGQQRTRARDGKDCNDRGQTLDDFVAEIRSLAEAEGLSFASGRFDADVWEADWADGLTPCESWSEERACIEEHRAHAIQRFMKGDRD